MVMGNFNSIEFKKKKGGLIMKTFDSGKFFMVRRFEARLQCPFK